MFCNLLSTTKTFPFSLILIWRHGLSSHIYGYTISTWRFGCHWLQMIVWFIAEMKKTIAWPSRCRNSLGRNIVGYVPKNIFRFFYRFFMLPRTSICAQVLGSRVNHSAGYELEVTVCSSFQGHTKCVAWQRKIDMMWTRLSNLWKMYEKCYLELSFFKYDR